MYPSLYVCIIYLVGNGAMPRADCHHNSYCMNFKYDWVGAWLLNVLYSQAKAMI